MALALGIAGVSAVLSLMLLFTSFSARGTFVRYSVDRHVVVVDGGGRVAIRQEHHEVGDGGLWPGGEVSTHPQSVLPVGPAVRVVALDVRLEPGLGGVVEVM